MPIRTPVRFVIGRAGTGKTHRCFTAIVDELSRDPLGPNIYWIVPKQATFQAERELTCASGLDGFCRVRVVSFEQLGEEILTDCGGGAIPQVTAAGRQMVLGHLLRTHAEKLQFFNSVARQAGLARELDATFAEFERCGKDCDDLKMLVADLESAANDPHARSLLAKFRDLHLLYDAYTKYLGQDRLDPHRRLAQVLECVEHCKLVQGAQVYVDGFYEFTDFERRTLAGVAKVCAGMEITLLMDPDSELLKDPHVMPDEMGLFHRTEMTYRQLWFAFQEEGIEVGAPVVLKETKRFSNPYLSHAEKFLFAKPPFGSEPQGRRQAARDSRGIELIVAPDRRVEVDAAARKIREWMLEGMRLRDIAVLTRNLDNYAELIDASFREHGIRYFVDRRRSGAHHPLPQVVRAVFLLALHNWPHEAMMTLLKSGLCGLSLNEADEVENYVLMHRIRGAEWGSQSPWRYVRSGLTLGSDDDDLAPAERFELERIDDLRRRVIDPLRPFVAKVAADAKLTIREFIVELFAMLERFNVRPKLIKWIEQTKLEERGEHEQVWAEFIKLLDQMADVMGDEVVSTSDFLAILESGLEQFDLALTPARLDQVLVGAVDRTRTPAVKRTIVLGVNEGEFPLAPRDETILSDAERRVLSNRKMQIDPDTTRRLLDEKFLGYVAFTRGSDRLCVTRTAADDAGRAILPSRFWRQLCEVFPDRFAQNIRHDDTSVETIGTPRQLVTRLMRWVRDGADKSLSSWANLYHSLATHECSKDFNNPIDVMRFSAWRALSYDNEATLSEDVAKAFFKSPLGASVSRIETFATCPFKHFARYGLELTEREDAEVSAIDLGNVYHGILEQLVRDMVRSHKNWGADPKNVTDAAIARFAKEIGESLRGELMLSSARNQYLLSHIERTLGHVIDTQSAGAARGRFKPIRAELQFGATKPDSLPALDLPTPNGNRIRLRGKIDRVDLLEEQAAFAVIDYKLSGNQLSLDRVYHGISLQLLTYLLVLQANGEKLAGRKITPAAAFYVKLLGQLDDVDHPEDATPPDEEAFHLKSKPRGLIHRKYLNAIDDRLAPGAMSEVVQVRLNKDGAIGVRRSSDAAEANEFSALLHHVEKRLAELGDQIIAGRIDVSPYRMGQVTPCPYCDYRAVCRFDTLTNRYNHLTVMGREAVLDRVTQEASDGE